MACQHAGANCTIDMGKAPDPPLDAWMGHSVGRWEGDTLIIETNNLNDRTRFDRAGDCYGDQSHVIERITPPGSALSSRREEQTNLQAFLDEIAARKPALQREREKQKQWQASHGRDKRK